MKIPRIISQITFGSGYPLGPGGCWLHANGRPYPVKGYDEYQYPGYPGMVPTPDERNPFGGILHSLNVVI